jgi:hypothetical protein
MEHTTLWQRFHSWLVMRPVYLAYWLIWLAARLGSADALSVYRAMWVAQLDLPPLPGRKTKEENR